VVALKGDGNFRVDMDIDGPGGEVITQVDFVYPAHTGQTRCLKVS
jgi:hypothetical protein